MALQITWFVLWGLLWAVYFVLDGYDFGAGMLQGLLGKTDEEKRAIVNSIGPLWHGNEVWLVTAGGATFAAFPGAYAAMFSYLYTALLMILFALIFRGVAIEFRAKGEGAGWKRGWDAVLLVSSFVPPLLFGVAFGNIFQGLPMDAGGYHGSLVSLLNPYGLLTGAFFVLLFLVHGALWVALKTEGPLQTRAGQFAGRAWYALLLVAVAFLVHTAFATGLYANYLENFSLFAVPLAAVASLISIKPFASARKHGRALVSSALAILAVMATGLAGLYPNLIPSSIDPAWSLTIFNSSSSPYTLRLMTVVAALFIPVAIAYQAWVHRVFGGKSSTGEY